MMQAPVISRFRTSGSMAGAGLSRWLGCRYVSSPSRSPGEVALSHFGVDLERERRVVVARDLLDELRGDAAVNPPADRRTPQIVEPRPRHPGRLRRRDHRAMGARCPRRAASRRRLRTRSRHRPGGAASPARAPGHRQAGPGSGRSPSLPERPDRDRPGTTKPRHQNGVSRVAPGRIRTCDRRIRSPLLCPLSYGRRGRTVAAAAAPRRSPPPRPRSAGTHAPRGM